LILYLDEDSSIENAAAQRLQSRIKRTKIENAKPRIQQHMEGTRGQQDKSKQLIQILVEKGLLQRTKPQLPIPIPTPHESLTKIAGKMMTP
jgi:ferritin-like metal-binding protein YciE